MLQNKPTSRWFSQPKSSTKKKKKKEISRWRSKEKCWAKL